MPESTSFLFNIDNAGGSPRPGALLVAEPFLRESYFNHAVICIIDHGSGKNTMGLVLNRQISHTLSDLVDGIDGGEKIPVFCGGPMSSDRLFFLHTLGPDIINGAREVVKGLWVGGDFDQMKDYIAKGYPTEGHVRFFIGYSGWSPQQLEAELAKKVWAVTEISDPGQLLIGADNSYWHAAVRRLGPAFRGWQFHPQNPLAN